VKFQSKTATFLIVSSVTCAAVAYLLRNRFPPFCIGFGCLFVALLYWSLRVKRARAYIYNLAFVFLALAIAEFLFRGDKSVLGVPTDTHYEGTYTAGGYFQRDKELGTSISPGPRTVTAGKRSNDGKLIYSATYTIDEFGFREMPVIPGARDTVYFFGCSFTFGEGVNDADAFPYRYSLLSGRRVRDFGVHGYGPHQMLRALETDRPKILGISDHPALVIYVALSTHVYRAAGKTTWDVHGPLYEIRNGTAEHVGSFSDQHENWLRRILNRSFVIKRLAEPWRHRMDLERYSAIVRKSRDLVAQRYGAPFVVVLWETRSRPNDQSDADWIFTHLTQEGVNVLRLAEVVPDLEDRKRYIRQDGHPSAELHERVAQALYDGLKQIDGSLMHTER
jgi:hypothetical protein